MNALKNRKEWMEVLRLSWPPILESLLLSLASYIDSAMLGAVGPAAQASVAVNISTVWLLGGLMSALGLGFTYVVANSVGARDYRRARSAARHAILGALLLGLALTGLVQAIAHPLPMWLGADPEIYDTARVYMRIIGASFVFQALSRACSSILRGAGQMKLPLVVNVGGNLVNIIGNTLLIFPRREVEILGFSFTMWGADMSVAGAAAATLASHVFAGVLLLLAVLRANTPIRYQRGERCPLDPRILKDAWRVMLPNALEQSCLSLGQIAMTSMVAPLGTISLAAHNQAVTAEGICYLPAMGLANSATTLVGQSLGAKEPDRAQRYANMTCVAALGFMLVLSTLLFIFAEPLIRIFSRDAGVIELGRTVLRIVAFGEPFYGLNLVISGTLAGAGDSRHAFLYSAIGMWGIRTPMCLLMVKVLGWGLAGAWLAMAADLIVRGILCTLRLMSGKWKTAALTPR